LVEVIGPAAVGKTTLLRALCSTDEKIHAGLGIGRIRFSRALLGRAGPFLPVWVVDHRHD
jgi:ABC-type branched-subunit amino acid transport system ATPase component